MSDPTLARALADAFLAGDWHGESMVVGAAGVLGPRRRWVPGTVRRVLAAYPRPPHDRARELAQVIERDEGFALAVKRARVRGRPMRARRMPVAPSQMGRAPWPVPPLDDDGALASLLQVEMPQLLWLADPEGRQRRAPDGALHHYRYHWVRSASGARLLEAPKPTLRAVQRRLLRQVLAPIPVHDAAHGFVPGRSAITGARLHVGADVVVTMDVEGFFAAITAGSVYALMRRAGYPQTVAHLLTALVTTRTPVAVLAGRPRAVQGTVADVDARVRQRAALRAAHLPQGAPTSPAVANLCCFALDRRLAGYAAAAGLTYTRYADDLTFSGPAASLRRPDALARAVTAIASQQGLRIGPAKTRVRRQHQRQVVTGIVVNETTSVTRADYDALKATLHNCARHGPGGQDREGVDDLRGHLLGRISWVASLHPAKGARLREMFHAIAW